MQDQHPAPATPDSPTPSVSERWSDLPDYVQTDLLEWLNLNEPGDDDRERLLDLYDSGRFHAWNCPTCGARVQSADIDDDGESWAHFQGVRQPNFSYFGDSDIYTEDTIRHQCDTCRCHPPVERVTWPEDY